MMLMLHFTLEDVSALSAIKHPGPPLQVKFAVVRLVGGLRLEDNVT